MQPDSATTYGTKSRPTGARIYVNIIMHIISIMEVSLHAALYSSCALFPSSLAVQKMSITHQHVQLREMQDRLIQQVT